MRTKFDFDACCNGKMKKTHTILILHYSSSNCQFKDLDRSTQEKKYFLCINNKLYTKKKYYIK